MSKPPEHAADVVIIGGGASGTALLYILSRYTDIQHIILLEKYASIGGVNSNAKNNSQTLHVGDIETNYSEEKVRQVKPASMMVKRYVDGLPRELQRNILRRVQKMVLAVGANEVAVLEKRYDALKEYFPELQKLDGVGIAMVEPEVMRGRDLHEPVLALFNPDGYAINFGMLAESLVQEAQKQSTKQVEVLLEHKVLSIDQQGDKYILHTNRGTIMANAVVVNADAHSLGFAKKLGYGKNFSLIPVAGSFYFTPERLRGKVYRVQEPRMPFAAIHGDPDLTMPEVTRWGPTARFYPVLEARRLGTTVSFFASAGLHRIQTWASFITILLEPIRFIYLLKNFFYDLPIIGKYMFLPQVQRIVPTLRAQNLRWAKGYGGMRLQRVDTNTKELLLGEGKIIGVHIIFNMSPSPGASVCLYNAMRDTETIIGFFNKTYSFHKEELLRDLYTDTPVQGEDISLKDSYPS